jgi:hypothetical protein
MTEKKEAGTSWRHTSVVVRADIFSKAHEQGIDISNICNKALADLLGVDYHQQQLDDILVTRPVIIAHNDLPATEKELAQAVHGAGRGPVINADDPAASATVRSAKQHPKPRPAPQEVDQAIAPHPTKETAVLSPATNAAHTGEGKKPAAGKTQKDNGLKKFVSAGLSRSDAGDAVLSKDDMYQAFIRFCREHKITPVPDRKTFTIALKNKFAFFDKTVNGIPSWVNVRLK